MLKEDLDKIRADYDSLLESSDRIISNLRAEMYQLRSKLDIERADREEVETELSDMGKICTELRSENFQFKHDLVVDRELPEAGDLLNQLKAWRKKSKSDLTDVVKILEILDL